MHGNLSILGLAVLLAGAVAGSAAGQQPASEETFAFFKTNCASCHTIGGGRLTGPDLRDVADRQTRDWLLGFVTDPSGVLGSGDPYAQTLLQEARGVPMQPVPGMTRELAGKLLDLVDAESLLERSQFAGVQISDRPLTATDIVVGRGLFEGTVAFENGGPACYSCHSADTVEAGFGGGRLGPDLTSVYARMGGRKALAAWLSAPPMAVMLPIYETHGLEGEEILQLVAFLKDAAATGKEPTVTASLDFILTSFGAAALVMAIFDFTWRRRFRAVRRPLVQSASLARAGKASASTDSAAS